MLCKYLHNLNLIYSYPFHCTSTFTSNAQYQTVQTSLSSWQENMQLIEKKPLLVIRKEHIEYRSNADLYSLRSFSTEKSTRNIPSSLSKIKKAPSSTG